MKGNNIIFLIVIGIALILLFVLPKTVFFSDTIVCMHHKIFGIECPFCGLTRAAYHLSRLNFTSAAHYNLAAFPLGFLILNEVIRRLTRQTYLLKITYALLMITTATFIYLYALRINQGITS
jgi:hypothetical protein